MPTLKHQRPVLLALSLILLCAQYAIAQTVTGAISGTVVDASGNAVAGAAVRLVNERTNDARVLTTGESTSIKYLRSDHSKYS